MPEVQKFAPDAIAVPPKRRAVDPAAVDRLVESIRAIGLRTPITVRLVDDFVDTDGVIVDGQPVLVTGAHRLEAAKRLGLEKIECYIFETDDDIEARRWEIAENLHRAELTDLERRNHIAEWIRLTEEHEKVLAELSTENKETVSTGNSLAKGGRGKRSTEKAAIQRAAKELGVSESDARRSLKVASLTDEAKETAREVGLDDNRSALLKAAKAQEEGKDASEILRDIAAEKEAKKQVPRPTPSHVVAAEKGRSDGPFTLEDIHRLHSLADYEQLEVILTAVDLGWAAAHRKLERYELAA